MSLHQHPAQKVAVELSLFQAQLTWLQSMASKFSLPDKDKALRIVLTYARAGTNGEAIYGKKSVDSGKGSELATMTLTVEDFHVTLLEGFVKKYDLADISEAARSALDFGMSDGNEQEIFGVVRCKHGKTCDFCVT